MLLSLLFLLFTLLLLMFAIMDVAIIDVAGIDGFGCFGFLLQLIYSDCFGFFSVVVVAFGCCCHGGLH